MAGSTKLEVFVVGDASHLNKTLDQAGNSAKKFGKIAAVGIGVGLGAAAVGMKKAVDAASNLAESQNAVRVVFGKSAKTIDNFSKQAARKAGLSMRELNELVTPLGAAFTNMGDSQQVAADKSVALAKRAADMASVFNVDVKDALGAIQAGLRGEADPLERFGVGLSDTAVSAQALTMGLAKTKDELTAGDKAQARYALLMQQTDKVAGDFANTSSGLANQKRILRAELENVAAAIGEKLIPMFTVVVTWLGAMGAKVADWLLPKLQALKGFITDTLVPALSGMVTKIREEILPALNSWWKKLKDDLTPAYKTLAREGGQAVGDIAKATKENKGDLTDTWTNLKGILDELKKLFDDLGFVIAFFVAKPFSALISAFKFDLWDSITKYGIKAVENITREFHELLQDINDVIGGIKSFIRWLGKIPGPGDINIPGGSIFDKFGDAFDSAMKGPPPGSGGAGAGGLVPGIMDDLAAARSMGLSLSSGLRPGARTRRGTLSDHAKGKAIDVVGSAGQMARFFSSLIGNRGVKQAFYDPLGSIFGGIPSSYREGGHSKHVHVATYAKGGIFSKPTLGIIGERGPEAVVPLSRGGGRPQQINLIVDGRTLASILVDPLRNELRQVQRAGGTF